MKRPVTMAAMLLIAACGENPTAPAVASSRPAPSAPSLSLASLADARAAGELTVLVAELKSSVASGDVVEAQRLLTVARSTVDPNGDESTANLGDPADLAALRLTLANLAEAIGS
jgi:hypothetical protein